MRKVLKLSVLLLTLFTLLLALSPASQVLGQPVFKYCHLIAHPDQVLVWDMHAWASITLDHPAAFIPASWDASHSTWRGYNSDNPFGIPDDSYPERYNITLKKTGQPDQWVWILVSKATPNTDYVWVFTDISTHADVNGNHNGTHPCRVFSLDSSVVENWFSLYTWKDEMPTFSYPLAGN